MMEFTGEFTSEHSREELWKYFTDPEILADCAPGCDEIEVESPSELTAVLSVGVGSVKPTFDVEMTVIQADAPAHLAMEVGGTASRNSFEATAEMQLTENGDGSTAQWEAQTTVGGLIASMGQRALDSVSSRLVQNFFEDLEAKADEGVPAESKLAADAES